MAMGAMERKRFVGWLSGVVLALTMALVWTPAVAAPTGVETPTSPGGIPAGAEGPEFHTFIGARGYATKNWGATPRGANNFSCKPKPGQFPVVLIPGTGNDAFTAWSFYSPRLSAAGFCVFTFNYNPAVDPKTGATLDDLSFSGDINASAAFLGTFVDKVLAATGSSKVTLVGHSQGGGPLPRAYLKWHGGAAKVNRLIGLTPSNYGTSAYGIAALWRSLLQNSRDKIDERLALSNKLSLTQQLTESRFLTDLNDGGDTLPGVEYVTIATHWDQVVVPFTRSYLKGYNVTNIKIQELCPVDPFNHMNFTYDPAAFQVVKNFLDPKKAEPLNCYWIP